MAVDGCHRPDPYMVEQMATEAREHIWRGVKGGRLTLSQPAPCLTSQGNSKYRMLETSEDQQRVSGTQETY